MKVQFLAVGLLTVAALTAAGCKSSAYEGRQGLVEDQLDQAREAGASRYEVDAVKETVERARTAEERAAEDQQAASEDLKWARDAYTDAQSRLREAERDQAQVETALSRAQQEQEAARAQRQDLIDRGVPPAQADSIVGVQLAMLERRIEELQAEQQVIVQRLELAQLDQQTAQQYQTAAESRMQASQDRMQLAVVLYSLAEKQGRVLEAEALRIQRGEAYDQLQTQPDLGSTTLPAGMEREGVEGQQGGFEGEQPQGDGFDGQTPPMK